MHWYWQHLAWDCLVSIFINSLQSYSPCCSWLPSIFCLHSISLEIIIWHILLTTSYADMLHAGVLSKHSLLPLFIIWTASSEFGTYRIFEQRRFRRAWASVQSRQNLRCSLIQAVSQEEPSDRKPDPWPLWMAGHAQLKFVMTECWKTQIRLTGLIWAMSWKPVNAICEKQRHRSASCQLLQV